MRIVFVDTYYRRFLKKHYADHPSLESARYDIQKQSLIDARTAARAAKDFKESDRIRDELAAMGVVLKDSKEGTTWEIAR